MAENRAYTVGPDGHFISSRTFKAAQTRKRRAAYDRAVVGREVSVVRSEPIDTPSRVARRSRRLNDRL